MHYDAHAVEARWSKAWERGGCFRAPSRPTGPKYFNYDSGPFPNGALHMGHVRTYVLGDVTARYQRLLGKSVLYATEWDAFGLPNELAALATGVSPHDHTQRSIAHMEAELRTLGISYDWSRVRSTASPGYVRGTQSLFLDLLAAGRIDRREAPLPYCPSCGTSLARMQVSRDGACWRCSTVVETRPVPGWFVAISLHSKRLLDGLDGLPDWSESAKGLLAGFIGSSAAPLRVHDWMISRQRSWGTPIPIVHCAACGTVPLSRRDLPLLLPEDLRWDAGPHPLAGHPAFRETRCPRCGGPARRETDTLDCFFDDIWCFLASLVPPGTGLPASREAFARWLPVDRFHSGLDTFFYLHLHRFLGIELHERGFVPGPELIRSYIGHEMVLAGGRKMSKHLGNTASPGTILASHGADALRAGILWAASPQRALEWNPSIVEKSARFLREVHELYFRAAPAVQPGGEGAGAGAGSRAAQELARKSAASSAVVGRFIDEYRMSAAVEELAGLFRAIRAFAIHRVESRRLDRADAAVLREVLSVAAVILSPFAPHLAEECRAILGLPPFAATARWPLPRTEPREPESERPGGHRQ